MHYPTGYLSRGAVLGNERIGPPVVDLLSVRDNPAERILRMVKTVPRGVRLGRLEQKFLTCPSTSKVGDEVVSVGELQDAPQPTSITLQAGPVRPLGGGPWGATTPTVE